MTKKHFIALADHIKTKMRHHDVAVNLQQIESLADFCASQNPHFNRERWINYIAGTCGKNGGKIK